MSTPGLMVKTAAHLTKTPFCSPLGCDNDFANSSLRDCFLQVLLFSSINPKIAQQVNPPAW